MTVDAVRFLGRLVGAVHDRLQALPDLEVRLADVCGRARAAWPTVELADDEYLDYLAERIDPEATADVLAQLCVEDLFLAAACARGDSAAIRACERAFAHDIDRGLDLVNVPVSLRDEVWSRLRDRIFVPAADAPPAIATFTGRGSLKKWLRVAATRLGISLLRERHRETALPEHDLPDAADDLELGHLKRTYQTAFKTAFVDAMTDLTTEQRTLLRMHLIDKLSIDDLARMHRVHRTSTARWLREAREVVAQGTRRRLHAALGVRDEELDSIMNIVRSRLDLSLSRLFAGTP